MANGIQSWIARVGIVQTRMFDAAVRIVTGVRHVPSLKINLISLGAFRCKRLPVFISWWYFECLQRGYGSLARRNV